MTRHARKGQPHLLDLSRPRQRTRSQAAKRSRTRRFPALYERMFRPDMLWRAWRDVRAQGGSAGIDEVQIDDVERQGVPAVLPARAQDLRAGSDRAPPVRRVSIPTPEGRQRPLGMPTVRDRVGQQACTSVLEPLCEANVQDTSSGFRPQRSATQAVKVVTAQRISHGDEEKDMGGARHGGIGVRLIVRLASHVEAHQLGGLYGPDTTFRIGENERIPDIAFVSAARLSGEGEPEGIWPMAPDLAVEIISPNDLYEKVISKIEEYFAGGVRQAGCSHQSIKPSRWFMRPPAPRF